MATENKVLLNIYSGDRVSGTNTSFDFNIAAAQLEPKSVEFLSFESPASFQNITSNYNTFIISFYYQTVGQSLGTFNKYTDVPSSYFDFRTISAGEAAPSQANPSADVILTINPGSYTGETLAATLKSSLITYLNGTTWYYKTAVANNINVTYDAATYKITITSSDGLVAWWVRKSYSIPSLGQTFYNTLYTKIGLSESQDGKIYMGVGGMTSASVSDLSQPPVIYIYARGLSNNSSIDSKGNNMDLLFKVQNNAGYGSWIYSNNFSPGMARINVTKPLDHIYIQLRDQSGNILVSESEFTMTVVCYL